MTERRARSSVVAVDPTLGPAEIAKALCMSRQYFYRPRRAGKFPAPDLYLPGREGDARLQRWRASTVEKWLSERMRRADGDRQGGDPE